jgi:Sporulation and spore germination
VKRLIAVALASLTLASCGSSGLVIVPRTRLRALAPDLYGSNVRNHTPNLTTVRIYLVDGTRLAAVDRTGRSSLPLEQLAMVELLKGPTNAEQTRGLTTNVPASVQLLNVSIDDRNVASVDLSHDFELATLDRATFLLRLAQVVYTLTELNNVQSVRFLVEGQPVSVLVEDGTLVAEPVARGRYSDFAPRSAGAAVSQGPLA